MSSRRRRGRSTVTTFALIHGTGDGGGTWHLVQRALRDRGYEAVAPDLPTDRDDATWEDCADTVLAALGGGDNVAVVGQSSGGFVVPLVAQRVGATLQVFVAGMVPWPAEAAGQWFDNVGWAEAMEGERPTGERLARTPWPLSSFPRTTARFVVTTRDRFIPPSVQRRVAAESLGVTDPDEIETGHCPHLSRPEALARLLVGFVDGG